MNQDGSLVTKLSNVIGVTQKKGDAYESKVQADADSIMEYGIPVMIELKDIIAFPCSHRQGVGNCQSCLSTKIHNAARYAAKKGWELTKQYGHRQLSESNKKLMG